MVHVRDSRAAAEHICSPKISAKATYALANAYMIIQSVGAAACTGISDAGEHAALYAAAAIRSLCMILDMGSHCSVFIPLAMLGGLVWHWPTIAVIICVNVDQLLKCIPAFIRVNSYKWVHRLTRDAA